MKENAEFNVLLNVLCLEDDLNDAELANEMLVDAGYKVSMDIARGEKEYVDFLKGKSYNIIIADNSLPGFDALAALKVALALKPEIPFICVSGTIGEEKAVELLKQGACDYVIKDRLGRLAFTVRRALKEKEIDKERKNDEEELRTYNELFKNLNKYIPAFIGFVNAETLKYEFVNDLYEKSFGLPREKIIGCHVKDVIGEANYQFALKYINEVKSGKSVSYENTFDIASGKRWLQVNYSPVFDDFKKVIGIAVVNYDISERKQMEEEVIKSQLLLSSIIECQKDIIIFSIDKDYRYLHFNNAHLDAMKNAYNKDIRVGMNILDCITSEDDRIVAKNNYDRALAGESHSNIGIFGDSNPSYYESFFNPIRNDNNEIIGATGLARDITERKHSEELLENQKDALEMLSSFAIELSNLTSDYNLESLIAKRIKEMTRAEVAIFSDYNSENRTTTTKHIEMESGLLEKIVNLLGKQIKDIHSVVSDENYRIITAEMIGIRETLHEASFGAIPRSVGAAIQALLKVDRIIGLAYIVEGKLYGTSILLMGKGQPDPPKDILESFINLAAVSLRRKKAEKNLLESEEKFKAIFQHSNDAIVLYHKNSFIDCNPQALKLFKIQTKEEFIKVHPSVLSPPVQTDGKSSFEASEEYISTAYREGYCRFDWIHRRSDGEDFNADVILSAFDYGGERILQGTIRDITRRKHAELALIKAKEFAEESELSYRMLFGSINDAVIVTRINDDRSFKFLNVNDIACKMYGYTHEEFLTKTPNDIISENSKKNLQERVNKILNNKYAIYEIEHVTKYGKTFPVEISTRITEFRNNTIFHSVIRDISERKQAEQLVKESNKELTLINTELIKAKEKAEESDRLKSTFLTNMSHEIRTPMNGIIGFTELLKEPHLTIDEQQDFIQTIQISGARMLNTINSIIDMSKIDSGLIGVEIKETNFNEKIEFTYKFFKPEVEKKGLQFLVKKGLPTKEAIIKTDNEKVYGVLTNLVRNAIKFTYEGSIEFGYMKKGEYLELYVKDTGIGIPKNQQEIVFERFRQGSESHSRGYEGSGLGLSISKSYVDMLGGKIWVESEEGLGSTFYFTIPYNPVSEETNTIENDGFTENKKVQIKKLKILIVEDDEISYSLLSRVVQKISNEVLHVITGVQAVETCRNNPDIDLVLMDIRMPMMNGLEATQQIRQFNKDVIIIAQTAYGFSGDSEKAREAGCNDNITKPINRTLLYELINKHCNK
jgi:PAS domain S-box-containing protein